MSEPEERARKLFNAIMSAPYGDSTIGSIVCAETTSGRLEAAWLPIITEALYAQPRKLVDASANGDKDISLAVRHNLFVYEVDFGEEGKGRYIRLDDFNKVVAEHELAAPQPREVRGVEGKLRGLLDRIRPGVEVAPWVYAEISAMFDATTPQDAAGVEEKPAWWEVRRESDPSFPRVFKTEGEADRLISFVTVNRPTKHPLYTTPPPGVDVGKLRELVDRWRDEANAGYLTGKPEIDSITEARQHVYLECADKLDATMAEPGVKK